MKLLGCEHEHRAIRAFGSGQWTSELRRHISECEDCSEALRIAEALREESSRSQIKCQLPDPYWILQRSRQLAREAAVRRMSRLLKAMQILASTYAVAAAAWLTRDYVVLPYREIASSLHGASSHFALLGTLAAAACVTAGLWPILRGDANSHGFGSGR
jgi:hypothetical protein